MVQPIRDGDHKILGFRREDSTLIVCILVVVIYATTAMISSENPDTRDYRINCETLTPESSKEYLFSVQHFLKHL